MYWDIEGIRDWTIDCLTTACLWIIRKLNTSKDRCLSQRLFEVAENYNTRPGTFNYYQGCKICGRIRRTYEDVKIADKLCNHCRLERRS